MREILFRAKDEAQNKWVYGYYIHLPSAAGSVHIMQVPAGNPDESNTSYYIIPETVGEYTGLTDKNGKKIFEGDILKIVHKYQSPFDDDTKEYTDVTTDVVFFDDEGLCFSYGKSPFLCVADNVTAEYEVVGNIHDNPELLEVTE